MQGLVNIAKQVLCSHWPFAMAATTLIGLETVGSHSVLD